MKTKNLRIYYIMPKKSRRKNKKRKSRTRTKRGASLPLEFQGKAELLQLIINEIQGLGGIFQTKEYNMVQNDYESTNIYIKKQDLENLPPDANGIPVYMVDNNNNPTNDRHTLPIAYLIMGYILIRKKDGDWFKSKDSQFQLSGGRRKKKTRKKKTRKKRGGVERWTRETLQPNPKTFDDIGYFYDCKPIVDPSNKSKYREDMIITGNMDANELTLPDEWKIIRMEDSEFYDPQLILVDMALPEGQRGMRWFRRRGQDLCNRGYKPLKRNDAKTGAGRKKKTRKKRGGWRRRDTDFNKDDIGYYYDCWNRDGNYDDVKYREGMTITGKWDVLRPISEWDIIEMQDSHRYDPNLILYDESRPNFGTFRIPAQQLCSRGFKPLKRNDVKTGAGRKKKTRKKRGAVKFGKNKTTAEIVEEGRKILQTTPQKKKRQMREQQIKLTGEKEFALFKKQATDRMKIAFIKSFNEPPSDKDGKMLSLVYKSLKQPLNKKENEIIQDYRAENNDNKRKLVWMNNSLRQLRVMSEKTKHQIYNTGDDPEVIKKYKPIKKQIKMGPASGLVVDTNKYMSPVKGPDTRYPRLSLDIGERGKSHKNLFKGGGRKKKRRTRKKNRR